MIVLMTSGDTAYHCADGKVSFFLLRRSYPLRPTGSLLVGTTGVPTSDSRSGRGWDSSVLKPDEKTRSQKVGDFTRFTPTVSLFHRFFRPTDT